MELHTLKPTKGSVKKRKRIARGQGSGKGGTSTRGHKGAKSRSGYSRKRNHEGGQTPLQMRVPKRGFNSPNRKEYCALNLADLQRLSEKFNITKIDLEFLRDQNYLKKQELVKVLGNGNVSVALTVEANACSATAKAAIEAAGGSINLV
jgi:large subunit ribosomal protein L15